ncbi:transposase [Streptomyces sp. enrichment culture]|uniref:transposase n=1 Tax=Streptomyces sp. enrichment culture TaxID=1795815 RepID=UPI003F563A56
MSCRTRHDPAAHCGPRTVTRTGHTVDQFPATHTASCPLDWELHLPREWADEPDRCRRAGVPHGVVHRETTTGASSHLIDFQSCPSCLPARGASTQPVAGPAGARKQAHRTPPRLGAHL